MTGRAGGTGPGSRDALPPGSRSPASPPPDTDPPAAQPTPPPGGPLRRVVRIVNPLGLHSRAADRFSKLARKYVCAVFVWNGDLRADGKDIWDLIRLMAMPDSEVILEVDGPDAPAALDSLAEALGAPGGEDYTI
jgi:phosphocarrier protein HPr